MTEALTAHAVPEPTTRRRRRKSRAYPIFRVLVLTMTVVLFITPLMWMLVASFKTNVDIYDSGKTFFFTPTLDNYSNVLGRNNYFDFIFNSFWVALWSTVFSLILGVPAAYAMSRFSMNRSAMVVLMARIIPGVSPVS